jgi:hypothetical protein
VLGLLLLGIVALLGLGTMVANVFNAEVAGRREDDRRTQAIWLARSAATVSAAGEHVVDVAGIHGRVTVRRSGAQVEASAGLTGSGKARVVSEPQVWRETFDR